VPLLAGNGRTTALEALEESAEIGRRVDAQQEMHVRCHHSDLEDPRPFLPRDPAEKAAQETGQSDIDE
jgi:hypothetical protein